MRGLSPRQAAPTCTDGFCSSYKSLREIALDRGDASLPRAHLRCGALDARHRYLLIPVLNLCTDVLEVLDVAGDDRCAVLDGMRGDFEELGNRFGVE